MPDFVAAFKAGQDAAEKAEAAKQEMKDVFKKLNEALSSVSDGKLAVTFQEKRRLVKRYVSEKMLMMGIPVREEEEVPYWAIVAHNPTVGMEPNEELATWAQEPTVYPCTVSWGSEQHACFNRQGLEEALAKLLQDPVVGEKLHRLSRLEPKKT